MTAIIDYGVGNLFSLVRSLAAIGRDAVVTRDEKVIASADRIILPGVGAFADAREKLRKDGMDELVLREASRGKPLLGICLGMQLLFEKSEEYGSHPGLGLLRGSVVPIDGLPAGYKVPHIGWNSLHFTKSCRLFDGVREGSCVYFVHSYHARGCEDSLAATTEYGAVLTAAVSKDHIFGCQFHPEKSGAVGLRILENFCEVTI